MNRQRIYAIFLKQYYLLKSSPTRFFQIFVWITVDIALWGFMSKYVNGVANAGFNFVPVFVGAILLWDFLIRAMQGITTAFFEDVWSRNFINLFSSPLAISEYVGGLVLNSLLTTAVALVFMLLLAGFGFHISLLSLGLPLLAALLILFLFGISLGIFGISIVLRFGPAGEWYVWPMPAVLSPLVGVVYPIAILPKALQLVSKILAPSYLFKVIRAVSSGEVFSWTDLGIALVLSILTLALAYSVFLYVYKKAVRTGLIARYSAESVS